MSLKYALRRKGKSFGSLSSLTETLSALRDRLRLAGGPYRLKRPGEDFGPPKRLNTILAILAWNLPKSKDGDVWRVMARADSTSPVTFSVRAVEVKDPVPDGPGTPAIDKIHAAVAAFCDSNGWPLIEQGICVDKPGEHGNCNAWDGNAGGQDSDEIHRRILAVAAFLKREGEKHIASGGADGLPVWGVIVMYQYWKRDESYQGWQSYNGTPHVSHWHVSGYPNTVPGWI